MNITRPVHLGSAVDDGGVSPARHDSVSDPYSRNSPIGEAEVDRMDRQAVFYVEAPFRFALNFWRTRKCSSTSNR